MKLVGNAAVLPEYSEHSPPSTELATYKAYLTPHDVGYQIQIEEMGVHELAHMPNSAGSV